MWQVQPIDAFRSASPVGTATRLAAADGHGTAHQTGVGRAATSSYEQLRILVEEVSPAATCIRVVLDNLNTDHLGALYETLLYETFPAEQAHAIASKLELHYTPVPGSWLNMVEIEWSVLARQGLDRPLAAIATVQPEVDAWAAQRNRARATVQWRFTTSNARQRFRRLYPTLPDDAS